MKGKVEKNKSLLKRHAKNKDKILALKIKIKDTTIDYKQKIKLVGDLHKMRRSSITRYRSRCMLTARVNGFKRITGLCGFQTRQALRNGLCPGFIKK